jgi:hypothetical protein
LTGWDYSVFQIKTKIVSCQTADSKPVKQEVNGKVILLVFSASALLAFWPNGMPEMFAPLPSQVTFSLG